MFTIQRTEDVDVVREVHALAFPADDWVGDDHEFWIARNEAGKPVGFCSAIYRPDTKCVLLSRAAVVLEARGAGLQRRMIRVRVAWARKIGARSVVSYTSLKNYTSMVNLLRCGFRFYTSEVDDEDKEEFHFLRLDLP